MSWGQIPTQYITSNGMKLTVEYDCLFTYSQRTLHRQYVEGGMHLWKCCNFIQKWPTFSVQICWMPQGLFTTMIANSLTLILTSYICFSCTNYTKANLLLVFVVFRFTYTEALRSTELLSTLTWQVLLRRSLNFCSCTT